MVKKLWFILIMCLMAFLTGCADSDDGPLYQIKKENGQYYLCFTRDEYPQAQKPVMAPSYSSLAEMKETLLSGELDDNYIYSLWEEYSGEKVPIYNLDQLYEFQFPGMNDEGSKVSVKWGINLTFYWYYVKTDSSSAQVRIAIPQSAYDEIYTREHDTRAYTVTSVETAVDRNATVTNLYNDSGYYRRVEYELSYPDKQLIIQENYLLTDRVDQVASDVTPYLLRVFGDQHDLLFYIFLKYDVAKERPSTEWLSSIGLVKTNDIVDLPNYPGQDIPDWVIPSAICVSVVLLTVGSILAIRARRKKKAVLRTVIEATSDTTDLLEDM